MQHFRIGSEYRSSTLAPVIGSGRLVIRLKEELPATRLDRGTHCVSITLVPNEQEPEAGQ